MKNKQSFTSAAWALVGCIISLSIIATDRVSFFGYPLFSLSILLLFLALWQRFHYQ